MRAPVLSLALALALPLLPAAVAAQDFSGFYTLGGCGAGVDGQILIPEDMSRIEFFESTCGLQWLGEIPGFGGAALYDMTCAGEGETWTDRLLLMRAETGGLIMLRAGFVQEFAAC